MLKTFTGFKGVAAAGQIGSMRFVLLASNPRHLSILWQQLMPGAEPLDPAGIKKAVLIEATVLPDRKPVAPLKSQISDLQSSTPTIEV